MRRVEKVDTALERVKPRQAAQELSMDVDSLKYLMREGRMPIGYVIKKPEATRCSYYIYRGLLEAEKERLAGGGERKW